MPRSSLPRSVIALGFVSLFMDVSSEMIHSLLPVFLISGLGAGALAVGLIEGVAEATASITKIFAGTVSDWIGRRKPLLLAGYGLAALTKPLFPLADSATTVFVARFIDRIGKGTRGAPRDALIADVTPPAVRGSAYGLRQSMDTVGAFLGPALALVLMLASNDDFRLVFWVATAPAVVAVAVLLLAVREPPRHELTGDRRFPLTAAGIARLGGAFWLITALGGVLTLARFSEAFLLLRGESLALPLALTPVVLIVMNVTYAASAWPLGAMADRYSKPTMLAFGITLLIAADVVLALAPDIVWLMVGTVLWGAHMGATQGLLSALVAETCPDDLRGTAFGLFNLVTGMLLLVASTLAGGLWSMVGSAATFTAGAVFAALALLGLLLRRVLH